MKPLSESHPTLWKEVEFKTWGLNEIQKFTVDVAEHERVKKLLFNAHRSVMAFKAEVERLKKELEEVKGSWLKPSTVSERCRSSFNNGVVEGERRAMNNLIPHGDLVHQASFNHGCTVTMERVKEAIEKHRGCSSYHKVEDNGVSYYKATCLYAVLKELGLGEEEKQCTVKCKEHGHCARCGDAHNDAWYS